MLAFAANSVLCRLALDVYATDPAAFSLIRLFSGAIALIVIAAFSNTSARLSIRQGEWRASFFLTVYVLGFSFAYLWLDAGTGALILFSTVQITMLAAALYEGDRPRVIEWVGWLLALMGVVVLTLPGNFAPSLKGMLLMVAAGVAWAGYTLRGRAAKQPLLATTGNFFQATVIALLPCLYLLEWVNLPWQGVILALLSGVAASAIGYVLWYRVLVHITTVRAALVQLSVPVLAAIGGIFFINEPVTPRFIVSALLVLSGIGLAVRYKATGKS